MKINNYSICLFFCRITKYKLTNKPNQTKLNQTNQSKPKTIYFGCLFKTSLQTKKILFDNKNKLTTSNRVKSKVPEKLARAAQLLYRPVLVLLP